jgi:hypothetical protein
VSRGGTLTQTLLQKLKVSNSKHTSKYMEEGKIVCRWQAWIDGRRLPIAHLELNVGFGVRIHHFIAAFVLE